MRSQLKVFIVAAAMILTSGMVFAQKKEISKENPSNPSRKMSNGWSVDPAHSSIGFTVKHLVISEVTGKFKDFSVGFSSTKDDFSDAVVTATIKVPSISTDNEKRDNHLKSDDFFNTEKYPEIHFKSTRFEKVGTNQYKIYGDLTIRDVTKKVVVDGVLNGSMKVQSGLLYAWKATTSVNRFDFGLKWNMAIESGGLVVGENVNIVLNLEMNKASV